MRHFLKLLVILAMVAAPLAAGAQDIRINPVPPGSKPKWTQVPGAPKVSWAPQPPHRRLPLPRQILFFLE